VNQEKLKSLNQMLKMKKFIAFITLCTLSTSLLYNCAPTQPRKEFPSAPSATGNAENLIRETNEPSNEFYPRISADGKYIFYNVIEITKKGGGPGGLAILDALAGTSFYEPEQITNEKIKIVRKEIGKPATNPLKDNAAYPAIMPNGNVLFTYTQPEKPVIAFTSPEGMGINYVSQSALGEDDSQPVVSNDGSRIVFSTLIGGNRMICSMDAKGGSFTVITEGYKPAFFPDDNNKIIYNYVVNKHVQIFTLDLNTGQKSQLTSGDYDNKDAALSFDGKHIAFASNRESPKNARCHIYIMNNDGTQLKQITQGETDETDPTWGPDNMLYFSSNAGSDYSIWKARPRL
jgi:TolB protein